MADVVVYHNGKHVLPFSLQSSCSWIAGILTDGILRKGRIFSGELWITYCRCLGWKNLFCLLAKSSISYSVSAVFLSEAEELG